jgi:hypothetical protein
MRLFTDPDAGIQATLVVWKPGARRVTDVRYPSGTWLRRSKQPGANDRLRFRGRRTGRYYVQVKITEPGEGLYTLKLVRK